MRHVNGSGKSGRIGTRWLVVAAVAMALLAAAIQTARACVTCTPGGKCGACSHRGAFLYADSETAQPGYLAQVTDPQSDFMGTGISAVSLANIPPRFECRGGIKRTVSGVEKTFEQIIVHWGRSLDDNGTLQSLHTASFQRCFERERGTGEDPLTSGPAQGVPYTESRPRYYEPVTTAGNDGKVLSDNGIKIGVTSAGYIIIRDKEGWNGRNETTYAKTGWELKQYMASGSKYMHLKHNDVYVFYNAISNSPISSMTVGPDKHYYKYDDQERLIRAIVMRGTKVRAIVYKRHTESDSMVRVRTTEVTFDSDNGLTAGKPRFQTRIHGYWVTEDDKDGQLRYVVNPDGAVGYLQSTGHASDGGKCACYYPHSVKK